MNVREALDVVRKLSPEKKRELAELVRLDVAKHLWRPQPGTPQVIAYTSEADVIGFGGAAGGGKASPLDTKVLTPKGWREIGSLRVGDSVTDPTTGGATKVIAVHPQGVNDIYRVWTDDGASVEVVLEHLWAYKRNGHKGRRPRTKYSPQRERAAELLGGEPAANDRWRTLRVGDTAQLMALIDAGENPRIPLTEPVVFTVNGRTGTGAMEPYLIGLYLGDGTHAGSIASCDDEIRDYFVSIGCNARAALHADEKPISYGFAGELNRAFKQWLEDHGLKGARAWEKFIPEYVLTSSVDYRLAVLQGLMDTDGYVDDRGRCYFTSTSMALAEGVRQLVWSLGGKAWMREKGRPSYTLHGEKKLGREAFDVLVQLRKSSAMFRLSRKVARCTDSWNGGHELMRAVVKVEKVREAEAVCITVQSPLGLYVTEDYIVTHNSDLALGKALTQHKRSAIFRRVGTELTGLIDRCAEIVGSRDGFNGQDKIWRGLPGNRQIEFGAVPNAGDEKKFQGRPKDLLVCDEATNFLEMQVRFLMGWVRTDIPGQKTQTLLTFNPPTSAEGRWVIKFFAPWLDPKHPNHAQPGELRWFATVGEGENMADVELPDGRPFVMIDGHRIYDPKVLAMYAEDEIIKPHTRTFIPAKVTDNAFLVETGYISVLQALPEPLRSQMLYGSFTAGVQDSPMQVCPTAWVEEAMARWVEKQAHELAHTMDSVGVDVARGGSDKTTIARRHGRWFDRPIVYPGKQTPDGQTTAGYVVSSLRSEAVVHIDVTGVGSSPYDFLRSLGVNVIGVVMAGEATTTDQSGLLTFKNQRSQIWWAMREALDPANGLGIMLPPDKTLLVELCAPEWSVQGRTIYVESRDDIIDRIGRSPDLATAYVLALMDSPKASVAYRLNTLADNARGVKDYDPFDASKSMPSRSVKDYDPYNV